MNNVDDLALNEQTLILVVMMDLNQILNVDYLILLETHYYQMKMFLVYVYFLNHHHSKQIFLG